MSAAFLKIEKNDIWQFIDQKRKKRQCILLTSKWNEKKTLNQCVKVTFRGLFPTRKKKTLRNQNGKKHESYASLVITT